jgi:CheY-like chemotaxis protein
MRESAGLQDPIEGHLQVVLIDDSDGVRYALGELLRSAGHSVTMAANGKSGIELLLDLATNHTPIDLLVVDLVMDEVTGYDVMAKARELLPTVPILAISGGTRNLAPDLPLELAAQTGAAACLQKPFSNEAFLGVVQRLGIQGSKPEGDRP